MRGKRGLIVDIANDHTIAWRCAKAFRALEAELAVPTIRSLMPSRRLAFIAGIMGKSFLLSNLIVPLNHLRGPYAEAIHGSATLQ